MPPFLPLRPGPVTTCPCSLRLTVLRSSGCSLCSCTITRTNSGVVNSQYYYFTNQNCQFVLILNDIWPSDTKVWSAASDGGKNPGELGPSPAIASTWCLWGSVIYYICKDTRCRGQMQMLLLLELHCSHQLVLMHFCVKLFVLPSHSSPQYL